MKLELNENVKIEDTVIRRILMLIRKISIKIRGGSHVEDIELED